MNSLLTWHTSLSAPAQMFWFKIDTADSHALLHLALLVILTVACWRALGWDPSRVVLQLKNPLNMFGDT
jgi:hypothetical protein